MDVCHKFGAEIWKLFFDPATSVSLPKEYSEEFKQMLVSCPKNGHSIVILNLSAVAHVCVIEIRETKGNVRFRIYQSYINQKVNIAISSERYIRCSDVNMSMTGQCISGAVFLKMLQQGIFWEVRAHVDNNGINQFLGFTYQAGKLVDRR